MSDSVTPWTTVSMEFSRPEYWIPFFRGTFSKLYSREKLRESTPNTQDLNDLMLSSFLSPAQAHHSFCSILTNSWRFLDLFIFSSTLLILFARQISTLPSNIYSKDNSSKKPSLPIFLPLPPATCPIISL